VREDYSRRAPETGNIDIETRVMASFHDRYLLS
jgi:hypothetical protein